MSSFNPFSAGSFGILMTEVTIDFKVSNEKTDYFRGDPRPNLEDCFIILPYENVERIFIRKAEFGKPDSAGVGKATWEIVVDPGTRASAQSLINLLNNNPPKSFKIQSKFGMIYDIP